MRRAGAALLVTVMLGIGAGCGSTAPAFAPRGCEEEMHGAPARVLPETSDFSCGEIREAIEVRPPNPGAFSFESEPLPGLWKCHRNAPAKSGVLLRCEQGDKRFSVVED